LDIISTIYATPEFIQGLDNRMQAQQDNLDYLKSTGLFSDGFLHDLSRPRFSADVHAIPQGRLKKELGES